MKHISSRENPLFKRLLRLSAGKPDDTGQLLLEGVHLCQSWLEHIGEPDLALFDLNRLSSHTELHDLITALPTAKVTSCDSTLIQRLSQVAQGQGVFFLVKTPLPVRPTEITENSLWLDRIQDPGNVGTLLRTAAAAGISHAYLSKGCASAWSAKVLRSAQGAHFVISIYENVDLQAQLASLKIPMLVTALDDAVSLYNTALPKECVWVFGNEGQGVAIGLQQQANLRLFVPQQPNVESLNVAVAAGICLFEQRRQHGGSP